MIEVIKKLFILWGDSDTKKNVVYCSDNEKIIGYCKIYSGKDIDFFSMKVRKKLFFTVVIEVRGLNFLTFSIKPDIITETLRGMS